MKPLIYKCNSITKEENKILHQLIKDNLYSEPIVGTNHYKGGHMTNFYFNKIDHPLIKKYNKYIYKVINKSYPEYCYPKGDDTPKYNFEIKGCWGIIYNKNEGVVEHNHFPYALSCVYYINTPNGSAPIKIKDKIYNVKAGECIIFLATDKHKVEFNDCKQRSAIVCNIKFKNL